MSETMHRHRAALVVVFASALLAGCSSQTSTTEERMGSFLVAPGKFEFYTCAHLAQQTAAFKAREKELEGLIARAGPDAGGRFVSAMAYRPEYIQTRGNLVEVRRTEVAKNCPPTVVVPPATPAAASPKGKKR